MAKRQKISILDKFDKADLGGEPGEVKWDRPFQRVMDIIQLIFGVNLLTMGLISFFLQSYFISVEISWVFHILISGLAIFIITFFRKLVAVLGGNYK